MNTDPSKRVLITGATRGPGLEIAEKLAANGNQLIINYAHNSADARDALRHLRELGADAEIYRADAADEEEVKFMFQNLCEFSGRPDILIHCANLEAEKRRAAETGDPGCGSEDSLCIRAFIKYYDSPEPGTVIRFLRGPEEPETLSVQNKNIRIHDVRTTQELESALSL